MYRVQRIYGKMTEGHATMETLGYYNGEYGPLDQMKVPMCDRVCFYGDGVYDATLSRHYHILYLDEHIDRLWRSASMLRIVPSCTKAELAQTLIELIAKMDDDEQFVYFQFTRGTGPRDHRFPDCPSNLWITLSPRKRVDLHRTFDVITYPDKRFHYCNAKTLNLIPNVFAAQAAEEADCQEAIFVRRDGTVTECAHSNIHILKDGVLMTHPNGEYILPGIARDHLLAMCRRMGIAVSENPFSLDTLMGADEVIISASSTFAGRVAHVDGTAVGGRDGDTLVALQEALTREFLDYTE